MATTPTGGGYWLVGVGYAYGAATVGGMSLAFPEPLAGAARSS